MFLSNLHLYQICGINLLKKTFLSFLLRHRNTETKCDLLSQTTVILLITRYVCIGVFGLEHPWSMLSVFVQVIYHGYRLHQSNFIVFFVFLIVFLHKCTHTQINPWEATYAGRLLQLFTNLEGVSWGDAEHFRFIYSIFTTKLMFVSVVCVSMVTGDE